MKARGLKEHPGVGARVQFTGYFLAATGQRKGSEGSKRFTVVECACDLCKDGFCAVDEPLDTSVGYEDQTEEWRANAKRHINLGNLQIIGKLPKAADLPEELPGDVLWPLKRPSRKRAQRCA